MRESGTPDRSLSQPSKKIRTDWTRTPAAIFACSILAIASISGLLWSWNQAIERELIFEAQPGVVEQRSGNRADPTEDATGDLSPIKLIDVNRADRAQLDLLPSIGPALADRIVINREEHGPYKSVEDLQRVSGIGPKTIEKLRSSVIVGD